MTINNDGAADLLAEIQHVITYKFQQVVLRGKGIHTRKTVTVSTQ